MIDVSFVTLAVIGVGAVLAFQYILLGGRGGRNPRH